MTRYEIKVNITRATGFQFWEVDAATPEEALAAFNAGQGTLVDEELSATEIRTPRVKDVRKIA